ncbi:Aspartate aminotransferase [sediment metagenome]|uniref:Aspartate aminotransferase n=1 Tax=sediment metagenome TaxID=749907 RepID=D9PJ87_9ZZZZ
MTVSQIYCHSRNTRIIKAISGKLKRDNNLDYEPNQIIVSNGAKQSLFNLFQAVIDDGDEVIIPAPYWVTYPELVVYSGGVPVIIDTDEKSGFKITPEQLKNAITPNTKMLILTSPSNPTGCVYSKEELVEISKVLKGTDILVASDEMYEKLVFGTNFVSTASISDDMFQRTITINGLSKSVAMTGWRFGYLASPNKELIAAMDKLQSQSTSNVNSITQKAAIIALNGEVDDEIEQMRKAFEGRANKAVELLNSIDGISVLKPQGAFYLFVNIKDVSDNSIEFCKELLKETGVAVVPGVGFGSEGYFRFSFATNMTTIQDGIRRIKKFVEKG